MHIRTATAADLPALSELFGAYLVFYEVAKPPVEVEAFLAARLHQGDSVILLARDDQGVALGFVQLYAFFSSLALQPAWLLSDLYVSPQVRRQGVGEALMNAARTHAEATGACGLQLETAKSNLPGQALYERLGYVRDEVFYTYWLALK
ncbi:GNAT family N-acetyltransferase [Pseudomonas sp. HMWF032]|uniref:GNAT family N-acetyltransferase n=1 Tax=unclassified Pseudomonas TaxID=196821 RepID=UPI000D386590|nr:MULTISPECIES: GNAT family N-acetyltransferase [unclassified Pseudomonas]PTS83396.1 GNAT family N-acetyltransferase [Pseudomonas sp. HMWF032]PTT76760.1 GNAT family N-acetyltransferase [Pseudomonas sp. HMWF010]WAC45680.1 GNAT family N-acetyltransferase [Pseudomonas sp. SL4(2022)]